MRVVVDSFGKETLQQLRYSYKYKKGYNDYTHFTSLNKLKFDPRLTLKGLVWVDIPIIKKD